MKKLTLLFCFALGMPLATWADVGFEGGNEFQPTNLSGYVHVRCRDRFGYSFGRAFCTGQVLDPKEMAYFVGPQNSNATSVTLKAYHADGSTETKGASYDGKNGKSKKRFNLWIVSLSQEPLLEMGSNRIAYSLLDKNKNVLASGEFIALVRTPPGARECRVGFLNSSFPSDCRFPQNMCNQYFHLENYCEY